MNDHRTEDVLARVMRCVADSSDPRTELMAQRSLARGRARTRRRTAARRSVVIAMAACVLAVIAIAGGAVIRGTVGPTPVEPVGTANPTHPRSRQPSRSNSADPSASTETFPVRLELKGWTCDPVEDQKTNCRHRDTTVQLTWRPRSAYPDWKAMSAGGEKITILGRSGRLWSGGAVAQPAKGGFLTVDNNMGASAVDVRKVAKAVVWRR